MANRKRLLNEVVFMQTEVYEDYELLDNGFLLELLRIQKDIGLLEKHPYHKELQKEIELRCEFLFYEIQQMRNELAALKRSGLDWMQSNKA